MYSGLPLTTRQVGIKRIDTYLVTSKKPSICIGSSQPATTVHDEMHSICQQYRRLYIYVAHRIPHTQEVRKVGILAVIRPRP